MPSLFGWMKKCIYCRIEMRGTVGINSILTVCVVQSLTTRLGHIYPSTGVSPHVWLHVFGRYLTKHLSGNLRCWYSRYPSHPHSISPLLPHARRFLGKGSAFEAGRHGCLMWGVGGGKHGLTFLTSREHSSQPGSCPLASICRPPTVTLANGGWTTSTAYYTLSIKGFPRIPSRFVS